MVERNILLNEAEGKVIRQDYDTLNEIMRGIEKSESYDTRVGINDDGRVVELLFADKELTHISPKITQLDKLENLLIRWTKDLDCLPEKIGNLKNLKKLDICYNVNLTALPESLGELSSLEELSIRCNPKLSEIVNSITHLQNLNNLDISDNNLIEIPRNIGNLVNLERLEISDYKGISLPYGFKHGTNKIHSLPESIGNLKNLKGLNLMSNALKKFPKSIGNLENLEYLQAGRNNISSFPESFFNLKNLKNLSIFSNSFSSLPKELFSLDNLGHLSAHYNKIRKLPKSILDSNLTSLDLNGNPLNNPSLNMVRYLRDEGVKVSTADTEINDWKENASSKIINTLSEILSYIKPRIYFDNSLSTKKDARRKIGNFTDKLSDQDLYLAMKYSESKAKGFGLLYEKPSWESIRNELRETYECRIDDEDSKERRKATQKKSNK